jgi:hypothetical protein
MAKRPRHKNKDIEAAIKFAEENGWYYVRSGSHAWGVFRCPTPGALGHEFIVNSTPRSPVGHAKDFRRAVARCLRLHQTGRG